MMNERIDQLYKEAEKSVVFLSNSEESKKKIIQRKFAELIVRECIAQCNDGDSRYFIATHFGVER